jgi:hypothetical protein
MTTYVSKAVFLPATPNRHTSALFDLNDNRLLDHLSVCLSVCPSVRPSVRKYQLGSQWMDLGEILYWELLSQSVEKVQICLKSGNIGPFTGRPKYVLLLPATSS